MAPYSKEMRRSVLAAWSRPLLPAIGSTLNSLEGRNVVGEEVTPGTLAMSLAVPISMRDIKKAMEEQGVSGGSALGMLSLFGVGLQSYLSEQP